MAFCVVELDLVTPAEAEDTPPAPVLPHTTQGEIHKQTPGNKRPFEDFEPASSITVVGGSLVIKGAAVAAIYMRVCKNKFVRKLGACLKLGLSMTVRATLVSACW